MLCNQAQESHLEECHNKGSSSSPDKQHHGTTAATATVISADEWFASGQRVHFDPNHKKMVPCATPNTIQVFERCVSTPTCSSSNNNPVNTDNNNKVDDRLWFTMLPSFPDGSYGFAKVERYLAQQTEDPTAAAVPRLYLEYVGQGDSEKPDEYTYNTMERADLVQAQWAAHGIQQTVVVACGYSSLVVLELLRRQQEAAKSNHHQSHNKYPCRTRILHVLCINGTVYADGQGRRFSWMAPLLQSRRIGHWSATLAQRSNLVLDLLLRPYTSRRRLLLLQQQQQAQRRSTTLELRETEKAIRRHGGTAAFLTQAAATLSGQEHLDWADRWDLSAIYWEYAAAAGISFDICASSSAGAGGNDVWQGASQLALVEERLGGKQGIFTGRLPGNQGGHLLAQTQVPWVCQRMQALLERAALSPPVRNVAALTDRRTSSSEPWLQPQTVHYELATSG